MPGGGPGLGKVHRQLEEGATRKQMRHGRTPAKTRLPVTVLLLEGNTDPVDPDVAAAPPW